MSILDPNFDIDDDVEYRGNFLEFIVRETKCHRVILLLDPDNVVNMYQLKNRFPDNKVLFDMSQCKPGCYVDFVKQYVLPFVNGSINYLLLDHIDKIPDIYERADFEQLLKFMAKGDEYDPFQNIHDVGRTGTLDFGNLNNNLLMRCAEVPEFLQKFTYIVVDCRNYVQYVDEMLED